MKRYGQVIGLRKEKLEEYRNYHNKVWSEVCSMITKCNIHNYSIFYKGNLLFAYFEYTGNDFEADMAMMAADPRTQEWWEIMGPMQLPVENRQEGEWWADMEEVFHQD